MKSRDEGRQNLGNFLCLGPGLLLSVLLSPPPPTTNEVKPRIRLQNVIGALTVFYRGTVTGHSSKFTKTRTVHLKRVSFMVYKLSLHKAV